jgi:hypothetical protein
MLTPAPSVVRVAKGEDHQECWRLLLQGFNENGLFGLAPDKVDWFLMRALRPDLISPMDTGVRGVIGVIGPVGALEGICFLTIGEYWYSHDKHIEEFIVFVDPEYRQSTHAKAFVEWMKLQSDNTGIPLLTGIISKERTAAKVRLYERMLPKVGAFFYYNGKGSMASSSAVYAS